MIIKQEVPILLWV